MTKRTAVAVAASLLLCGAAHAAPASSSPYSLLVEQAEPQAPPGRHDRHRSSSRRTETLPWAGWRGDMADVALSYSGSGNPTGQRGSWCAYFVNMIARMTGHRAVSSGMASAEGAAGPPTTPHRNAIAWNHRHTCIVLDVEGDRMTCVSGNNYRRRVGVSHYPVWAFRYAEPVSAQYASR